VSLARVEAAEIRVREIMMERLELTGTHAEKLRESLDEDAKSLREEIARLEEGLKERRTWGFADPNVDWQHTVLADLVAGLDLLAGEGNGAEGIAAVEKRHGFVTDLRKRSIDDHAQAWKETMEGVAASPKYGGLRIAPQPGLVPLGADPESGLFEFAHLGSGSLPRRDEATKRLVYADDAAVVLVLIPGGTFQMGAQRTDVRGPNHDPEALHNEWPVHGVTLSPFFLGKHEVTQEQWTAMTEGRNPSRFKPGRRLGDQVFAARNPVELVSWETCDRWLSRNRLGFPTEAQWEYACRAGTDTPWITGRDVAALGKVGNIADAYLMGHGGGDMAVTSQVDDGHNGPASVGSLAANAFGLHDVLGNVWEWCRDVHRPYSAKAVTDPKVEGPGTRVLRGGAWSGRAIGARSAYREAFIWGYRNDDVGVRAARPVEP
jgi:formylglycine-generating enzyme required for sulfatase activity